MIHRIFNQLEDCIVWRPSIIISPGRITSQLVCVTFAFFAMCSPALALTPAEIEAGNRAAQRIQNEQQERQQQQLREDAQRRRVTQPQEVPEAKVPSLPRSTICREIKEIVLTGVTLLPERVKQDLVAPYEGKCLYAEDIEKLLSDVLKAYIDNGYVAVRPYVQVQDLSTGRLEILIVEGRVEGLILKDGDKHSVNLNTAFPTVPGNALNLRDIEQGLDQINRLASNNATMEISPGAEPGLSVITITNTPSFPLKASASLDNLGGLSTGRDQGALTVSADAPLSLNDFFSYNHRNTVLEQNPYRDSVADSLFYSIPYGYWIFQGSYSSSNYRSPVTTSGGTLVARGTSETWRGEVNRVVYRDRNHKVTALVALNSKDSKNYLADEYLSVSSRKLAVLDADVNWNGRFASLMANLGLGISKGVRRLGALADTGGMSDTAPRAQGAKIRYSGGVSVPFQISGLPATFSSQATGQYALDPLYGSEQITIGSFYSVRGFNSSSLSGDRGCYLRNEFSMTLPTHAYTGITAKPFIAFDAGRIQHFKNTNGANLAGVAVGFRLASRHLTGEFSAARPVHAPDTLLRESTQFAATLSISF